jgi:hypothetical protein
MGGMFVDSIFFKKCISGCSLTPHPETGEKNSHPSERDVGILRSGGPITGDPLGRSEIYFLE